MHLYLLFALVTCAFGMAQRTSEARVGEDKGSSCSRPSGWCVHGEGTYSFEDCDGDGIPDPVCTDTRGLFGVIESTNGCQSSWPNGHCAGGYLFQVSGNGCDISSNCVSSKNYPEKHGNHEECTVNILADVQLTVSDPFEVERNYDFLRINNDAKWKAADVSSTLKSGDTISWKTDYSVSKSGWKICFAYGCPEGFELTFPGKPDGECNQSPRGVGEYGMKTGQTIKQCAQRCFQDAECFAFDFKDGKCYLNTRCDTQDEGDGYISCKSLREGTDVNDYYLGVYGEVCPTNYEILTLEECQITAEILGVFIDESKGWKGKTNGVPRGCSVQRNTDCASYTTDDGSLHFNTDPIGGSRCDLAPICKRSVSSDSESRLASIRSENDRLKHVNEALKKALEAMAN